MTELLAVGEKSFAWIPTRYPVVDGRPGGRHKRGGMSFRSEGKALGLVYAGGAWDCGGRRRPGSTPGQSQRYRVLRHLRSREGVM